MCRHFTWYIDVYMADGRYVRLLTAPWGSFFLFGVRGAGKSSWVRLTFPDAHVIDLLDEARFHALLANPELLALELADLPAGLSRDPSGHPAGHAAAGVRGAAGAPASVSTRSSTGSTRAWCEPRSGSSAR